MVLCLSEQSPKKQPTSQTNKQNKTKNPSTRPGNGIEDETRRENMDGFQEPRESQNAGGVCHTNQHAEPSGALRPHEDKSWAFTGALKMIPVFSSMLLKIYFP